MKGWQPNWQDLDCAAHGVKIHFPYGNQNERRQMPNEARTKKKHARTAVFKPVCDDALRKFLPRRRWVVSVAQRLRREEREVSFCFGLAVRRFTRQRSFFSAPPHNDKYISLGKKK